MVDDLVSVLTIIFIFVLVNFSEVAPEQEVCNNRSRNTGGGVQTLMRKSNPNFILLPDHHRKLSEHSVNSDTDFGSCMGGLSDLHHIFLI